MVNRNTYRAYIPSVFASKNYSPRPVRQLELLVEPKLAYTYTSTRGCAALAAAQTGTLMPEAVMGLDSGLKLTSAR
jgi:hypothetical protein